MKQLQVKTVLFVWMKKGEEIVWLLSTLGTNHSKIKIITINIVYSSLMGASVKVSYNMEF